VIPRQLTFTEAVDHALRLLEVVCSSTWVETLVQPAEDGRWSLRNDLFPPGGEETTMVACHHCQRIGPQHREGSCLDCDIARNEEQFLQLLAKCEHEVAIQLLRRWWRSSVTYRDFIDQPLEAAGCPTADGRREARVMADDAPYWPPRLPSTSDELPRGNRLDARRAMELALWRLQGRKKGKGRSCGCQFVLLPEDDNKLRHEIAFFRKHGRVKKTRKRYSQPNPFRKAPEDDDPTFLRVRFRRRRPR
jgi:hypothetical protein